MDRLMTRLRNPPHPGETLRDAVLSALGLSVPQAAYDLWKARKAGKPKDAVEAGGVKIVRTNKLRPLPLTPALCRRERAFGRYVQLTRHRAGSLMPLLR